MITSLSIIYSLRNNIHQEYNKYAPYGERKKTVYLHTFFPISQAATFYAVLYACRTHCNMILNKERRNFSQKFSIFSSFFQLPLEILFLISPEHENILLFLFSSYRVWKKLLLSFWIQLRGFKIASLYLLVFYRSIIEMRLIIDCCVL